jgi:hypothetical protein
MPNVPPQPKVAQIVWFENHLDGWAATPTAFGATAAQVTAVSAAVSNARKSYDAAQAAKQAAKNATEAQDQDVRTMLVKGRDLVNIMKSFIENANNPTLWAQSGLSPDEARGTAPDPTVPFELRAELDTLGNVIVSWKTSQPRGVSGVIYSVRRAIDGGQYVLLDSVGEKQFVDETVPVSANSISYTVKAKRGSQTSGWSSALTIRFGRVGGTGGGGFAIVDQSTSPSLAA